MRHFPVLTLALVMLPVVASAANSLGGPAPGSPGTATPQPYGQPQVRPLGGSPNRPPLLVNPAQPRPQSMPQPLPKDRPLPQLEEQRQRNSSHPAENIDRP